MLITLPASRDSVPPFKASVASAGPSVAHAANIFRIVNQMYPTAASAAKLFARVCAAQSAILDRHPAKVSKMFLRDVLQRHPAAFEQYFAAAVADTEGSFVLLQLLGRFAVSRPELWADVQVMGGLLLGQGRAGHVWQRFGVE